jgi:flagellar biosynthesis regulator FlaF
LFFTTRQYKIPNYYYFFCISYLPAFFKLAIRHRNNLLIISMGTAREISKLRRKPKTNNFKSILEQFLEKYNLFTESSPEQLNEHNKELDEILQDSNTHKCVKDLLTRRKYSKEKKVALLPDKRKEKLTIEKRAEYCAKTDNKWDIFDHNMELGPKNNNKKEVIASASR